MPNTDPTHCAHCNHSAKSHMVDNNTGPVQVARNGKVVLKNKNEPVMWTCKTCRCHDDKNKNRTAYHEVSFA